MGRLIYLTLASLDGFIGGGIPMLSAGVRRDLTLRRERRFSNGVVQATYDVAGR